MELFPVSTFLITVRNVVAARLCMYSQASVILFTGGKACAWQGGHAWQGACMVGGGVHGKGGVHGRREGHYSGWYASYWNAFLFKLIDLLALAKN